MKNFTRHKEKVKAHNDSNKRDMKPEKSRFGEDMRDEVLDNEFFENLEIAEVDRAYFDTCMEKLDETQFDSF